jgi:vacuolar-type H+-ATPase subunit F/Vma7
VSEIFVIAEEEIVLAFRMVGVEGRAASGRDEALEAFRQVTGAGSQASGDGSRGVGARILILTEEVADLLEEEAREWQLASEYPLIVEIPSQGERPAGRKGLVDAVREAIGVWI